MAHYSFKPELVKELYCNKGMTQKEIAEELQISRATVATALASMGVTREDKKEVLKIDGKKFIPVKRSDGSILLEPVK